MKATFDYAQLNRQMGGVLQMLAFAQVGAPLGRSGPIM